MQIWLATEYGKDELAPVFEGLAGLRSVAEGLGASVAIRETSIRGLWGISLEFPVSDPPPIPPAIQRLSEAEEDILVCLRGHARTLFMAP